MITKADIRSAVDVAEASYRECLTTLSSLKGEGSLDKNALLGFQPRLGQTLLELSNMYRALHQEKLMVVSKKNQLSPNWFKRRLRLINDYQEDLKSTISLGKCLGDSFAWAFYRNERQYLEKHYKNHMQVHSPPGVGGEGELTFISTVGVINRNMVLYHGLTTFLRLGDFSFIDLRSLKLTAVAELKTRSSSDGQRLESLLSVTSLRKESRFLLEDFVDPEGENIASSPWPQDISAKLSKQVVAIRKSFNVPNPTNHLDLEMDHNYQELETLWRGMRTSSTTYRKVGDGLL